MSEDVNRLISEAQINDEVSFPVVPLEQNNPAIHIYVPQNLPQTAPKEPVFMFQ